MGPQRTKLLIKKTNGPTKTFITNINCAFKSCMSIGVSYILDRSELMEIETSEGFND